MKAAGTCVVRTTLSILVVAGVGEKKKRKKKKKKKNDGLLSLERKKREVIFFSTLLLTFLLFLVLEYRESLSLSLSRVLIYRPGVVKCRCLYLMHSFSL